MLNVNYNIRNYLENPPEDITKIEELEKTRREKDGKCLCPSCGTELLNTVTFCSSCGAKIREETPNE